jgi:hypothetical protein
MRDHDLSPLVFLVYVGTQTVEMCNDGQLIQRRASNHKLVSNSRLAVENYRGYK